MNWKRMCGSLSFGRLTERVFVNGKETSFDTFSAGGHGGMGGLCVRAYMSHAPVFMTTYCNSFSQVVVNCRSLL